MRFTTTFDTVHNQYDTFLTRFNCNKLSHVIKSKDYFRPKRKHYKLLRAL